MLTDTEKQNESVTPNIKEIEILKKYFPQCFDKPERDENGNIIKEHFDIEKLSDILNRDEIEIKKEGFTLNFLGKSYARYQSNLDSETVIVPDKENDKTDSENVYIVGDNLDALQHLKYSYAEKIKCIYIDPPYNTGKEDFVYNDKFGFTAKELVEKLDISEEEAERIVGMGGKCTHSAWLTFMYPRLVLARELLRDDGVIFISIDDNEQSNLKRLCDEVFGEGNNLINCIWINGRTSASHFTKSHEYILGYAKNIELLPLFEYNGSENISDRTIKKPGIKNPLSNIDFPAGIEFECEDKVFPNKFGQNEPVEIVKGVFEAKNGKLRNPVTIRAAWAMADMIKKWINGEIVIDQKGQIVKRFFFKANGVLQYEKEKGTIHPSSIIQNITTKSGTNELKSLFDDDIFPFPKSTELIKYVMPMVKNTDIVLDFFSGSGTTAHSVMDLNVNDNGKRKFIMVQLNEPVKKGGEAEKAGYKTIDEIGRERIRRAAAKLKEEHPDTTVDLGFKTYYLKTMPQNAIDKIKVFDPNALISSDSDIIKTLGVSSLLQTWQIKDGFGFNLKPQTIDLQKYTAYLLDDEKIGKYLYLLTEMNDSQIKELIRKIESMELTIDKVFIYGYSFDFNSLTSIKTNLKTLKNRNPIEPVVRY